MAFQNHDIDTLEKGKMHVQLNYLDKEVQRLAKNLSFFATKDRTTTKLPASAVSATKEISYSSATTALPASDDGKSALFAFKQKADEKLSKSNGEAQEKTEEAVADEELDAKLDDLHEELDNILENGGWEEEENEEEGSDKEIAPSSQANVEAKVQEEAEVSLANNQVAEEDEDEDELDLR